MTQYAINYKINDKEYWKDVSAKNLSSAKRKIGRKHGYISGRQVNILKVWVIGYY